MTAPHVISALLFVLGLFVVVTVGLALHSPDEGPRDRYYALFLAFVAFVLSAMLGCARPSSPGRRPAPLPVLAREFSGSVACRRGQLRVAARDSLPPLVSCDSTRAAP